MNKLSYEAMDVTELENVMGGSEIKYVGCVITNGKCSTDGGCGICNGKCNGSIDQGSTDSKPIEKTTPSDHVPSGKSLGTKDQPLG